MNKLCGCGCGEYVNHPKCKFIHGHNRRGITPWNVGVTHSEETKNKMSESHKGIAFTDERKQIISRAVTGYQHSEESKLKMSKAKKGKQQTKQHILNASVGRLGRSHSFDTKIKISISTINYIEKHKFNGKPMSPRVGNNETSILNQLEKETGLKIDRNSRTLADITGKFCDGYISKYNIAIEILEPWHFTEAGLEYDRKRELVIASKLGCIVYYISEKDFLQDSNKELNRFLNFIHLL